ncbi:MAG: hypothetical protein GF408_02735 [Candidatus Omnitrophica bacterium]|nr:hypothetical protein [Candidatus Omnitrophota bacterium]
MKRSAAAVFAFVFIISCGFCSEAQNAPRGGNRAQMAQQNPNTLIGRFLDIIDLTAVNRDRLGLSREQLKAVRSLSADVRIANIDTTSKIQQLNVEMLRLTWESPFDTDKLNEVAGKIHALTRTRTEKAVEGYSQLNTILTPAQLKELSSML